MRDCKNSGTVVQSWAGVFRGMLGLAFALSILNMAHAESMFKVSAHLEVQPASPESTQLKVAGKAEAAVEMLDPADQDEPFFLHATLLEYPRSRDCSRFGSEMTFCNASTFLDMADPDTLRLSCSVAHLGQCLAGYDMRADAKIGVVAFSKRAYAGCASDTCAGID